MKRLNHYILTHYPQLWNLRIVWVIPALIIFHLLFFLDGYQGFHIDSHLRDWNGLSAPPADGSIGFSILLSVLTVITWLVFYLRNNPFKSFYPLRRNYFAIEFTFIMLIIFGSTTFYFSHAMGYRMGLKATMSRVALADDINTVNLAYALMPVAPEHYRLHECCDSAAYADSLKAVFYRRAQLENPGLKKEDYEFQMLPRHSERYRLPADEELRKIPLSDIGQVQRNFQVRSYADSSYSYFNFCYLYMEMDSPPKGVMSSRELSEKLHAMLLKHDEAAINDVLTKFNTLCDKFQSPFDMPGKDFAHRVATSPDIRVSGFRVTESGAYDESQFTSMKETLQIVYNVQTNGIPEKDKEDLAFWMIVLHMTFGFSLLLFTYRLTARRPWFIALVGSVVLLILVSLVTVFSKASFGVIMLMFTAGFYLCYFVFTSAVRKTLAGVNLIWLSWMMPYLGIIVLFILKWSHRQTEGSSQSSDNDPLLIFGYLALAYVYTVTILSMMYRRWQAMPEE